MYRVRVRVNDICAEWMKEAELEWQGICHLKVNININERHNSDIVQVVCEIATSRIGRQIVWNIYNSPSHLEINRIHRLYTKKCGTHRL